MVKKTFKYLIALCFALFYCPNQAKAENSIQDQLNLISKVIIKYDFEMAQLGKSIKILYEEKNQENDIRIVLNSNSVELRVSNGLLQNTIKDPDILVFFTCHELGHIFSKSDLTTPYVATEGAADYFAGASCIKRFFLDKDSDFFQKRVENFTNFLRKNSPRDWQGNLPKRAKLTKVDSSLVKETLIHYPSLQCRLDSLMAGINCDQNSFEFSSNHATWSSCDETIESKKTVSSTKRKQNGLRPLCWYAP